MRKDYAFFETKNDEIGTSVFEFLTKNTSVEWSQLQTGLEGDLPPNYISSSNQENTEVGATAIIAYNVFNMDIRMSVHSHPRIHYPSGLEWDPKNPGDVQFARWVDSVNRNVKAIFKLYIPSTKQYI